MTTHWSMVLAAGERSTPEADAALERLCQIYWQPLYVYARRLGFGPEEAQDMTQAFFTRVLEKSYIRDADRERGRFRSFLLASFRHFISKERARERAQKRGGEAVFVPIHRDDAEEWFCHEPADHRTPVEMFERRWVLSLMQLAFDALRAEYEAAGQTYLYEALRDCLTREPERGRYTALAERFAMSEGAVKVAAHRMRKRYRKLLVEEIRQTAATPADVEEELRYMLEVLSRPS